MLGFSVENGADEPAASFSHHKSDASDVANQIAPAAAFFCDASIDVVRRPVRANRPDGINPACRLDPDAAVHAAPGRQAVCTHERRFCAMELHASE